MYYASDRLWLVTQNSLFHNLIQFILKMVQFFFNVKRPPFVTLENRSDGSTIMTGGFCFEIMSALKTLYNFT